MTPGTPGPIAACMLGAQTHDDRGVPAHLAGPEFWERELRAIRNAGFDHVEISDAWIALADMSSGQIDELRAVLDHVGLSPCAAHIQRRSIIDPDDGEANLAVQHRCLEHAARLGVTTYSTGLHRPLTRDQRRSLWFWVPPGPQDPVDHGSRSTAVRRIQEIGSHAADLGMTVALELYEDTYLGTAAGAVQFVCDVGMDNVGLNPDVGNLIRLHRPVESWRDLYAATLPYAVYWHAKNYQRDEAYDGSWFSSMPSTLRDGIIDYRWVVRQALRIGYTGPIVCEHYGGDVLGTSAANRDYLVGLLDAIPAEVA